MPVSHQIDRAKRRVAVIGTGRLTGEELITGRAELAADPGFEPSFAQLIDLTGVTEVGITTDDIFFLASGHIFAAGSRRALVAPRPVLFGLSRMFQSLSPGNVAEGIRVFTDLAAAEAWLDEPADP